MPVRTFTFIAILFTSGLDVGLIMFPLTEFAGYGDTSANPEYGFANPLAIEFGFWSFLIWSFYFLTCFYFCMIEPRVRFFEIPLVKVINNVVIIGTCAFTAYLLPINDYHEFYLFWWFSWSIMIGQFTARFVSGIRTWQLFLAMLFIPSIAIGTWFTVLYHYHAEELNIGTYINLAMITVGVLMVVNSLDSLIRLYTDNLNLTVKRFGRIPYFLGNLVVMVGLTMLFLLDFLRIQWVGALVIGLYFGCFAYILARKRPQVAAIDSSPEENLLDFHKVEVAS